ncbi:aminopeptidase, partial [Escherichia coli]
PDVDRLWSAVAHAMRLDQPDPAAAWSERLDELEARARAMTERGFDAIRYRGPGTELEVGLIAGSRWLAGRTQTAEGHP